MISYDLIKNTELRLLVTASESIHSLPEDQIQAMIQKIAALPPKGELEMIAALKDEQEQIQKSKLARGITPEVEQANNQENMKKVYRIKKDFQTVVRVEDEKVETTKDNAAAEEILTQLKNFK